MKTGSLLLLLATSLSAAAQSGGMTAAPAPQLSQPSQVKRPTAVKQDTDEVRQQLDVDSAALSKIPPDPLIQPDPLAPVFHPVDKLTERVAQSAHLKYELLQALDVAIVKKLLLEVRAWGLGGRTLRRH